MNRREKKTINKQVSRREKHLANPKVRKDFEERWERFSNLQVACKNANFTPDEFVNFMSASQVVKFTSPKG